MSHTCEDKINNPIPDADLGLAYSLYTEWAKKSRSTLKRYVVTNFWSKTFQIKT